MDEFGEEVFVAGDVFGVCFELEGFKYFRYFGVEGCAVFSVGALEGEGLELVGEVVSKGRGGSESNLKER